MKYRIVKDAPGVPALVVEKRVSVDAMGVDAWVRMTPQSDPVDLWNTLQGVLSKWAA